METILQEIRYGLRQLRKSPGFAATATLTLALGIGAVAAAFTVVDSLLIAPLQYKDASRIVAIDSAFKGGAEPHARVTGGDYLDARSEAKSLAAIAYYDGGEMGVQLPGHAVFTGVQQVSAQFPQVFSLVPAAGQLLPNQGADSSALVSAAFARDNFGGVEQAVGKSLSVEGKAYSIAGVLPPGFAFPGKTNVWIGTAETPENLNRTAYNYRAIAKLREGVPLSAAQSELQTISHRLAATYASSNADKTLVAVPLQEQLVGRTRPMLLLLLGAVGLILLIVCVNLALIQLARSKGRQRETAVRAALGASRRRIVGQFATEAMLLAIAGGAAGIALGAPAVRLLVRLAPPDLPRTGEIHLNFFVVLCSFLLSLTVILLAAIVPGWQSAHADPAEALRQSSSRESPDRKSGAFRSALVVAEVAFTFTLATAAGLVGRTLFNLSTTELGFATARTLVMYAHAPANGLPALEQKENEFDDLLGRLAVLPGVTRVAGVVGLPTGQYGSYGMYQVEGSGLAEDSPNQPQAEFNLASPGYFSAIGIPLLSGRDFSAQDRSDASPAVIISASVARGSFPGLSPIGKRLRCGWDEASAHWMTVIGVVGDVRQDSPAAAPGPILYMPLRQHPYLANELQVVLKTQVAPGSLMEAVRKTTLAFDPAIATKFTTLDAMVGESITTPRFRAVLLGCFAGLGFLLATIGVYGVMAYIVAQRRVETGIRVALGADRAGILRLVILRALRMALLGIVTGAALSIAVLRLMQGMLSSVTALDPATYIAAAALLMLAATGAAFIPALRASSIDPMEALRSE